MKQIISWVMLGAGVVGFVVSFPLWIKNKISDRHMIGLTLVLSWAALWYAAYVALIVSK